MSGRAGVQLVPPPRAGLFENTANDPLEGFVRQTAEDLHFGQTRSPDQELVNGSRHIRQRRGLASWACSGSGFLGWVKSMWGSLPPIGAHKKSPPERGYMRRSSEYLADYGVSKNEAVIVARRYISVCDYWVQLWTRRVHTRLSGPG